MKKQKLFKATIALLLFVQTANCQEIVYPAEPVYKFSSNFEEQQEELENNPTLKRFAESRKEMLKDELFPNYHFVSPENTLGDPNGLCYWKGNWHMFYQFRQYEKDNPETVVYWGHAYSKDLIHWKDLPMAIYPEPGIRRVHRTFSGGTLAEDDRVVAMYHLTGKGNQVEISTDALLLNWEKVRRNPDLANLRTNPSLNPYGYPYRVWDSSNVWETGNVYYSLVGTWYGRAGKPYERDAVWHLFASRDLYDWDYSGEFVENNRFTDIGDDGSCPYFWPIGDDKYFLVFYSHRTGSQYMIGTYDKDRNRFVAESSGRFFSGPAAAVPDPANENKVIVVYLEMGGRGTGRTEWNGLFSLPRRFWLGDQNILMVEPAGDYKALRSYPVNIGKVELNAGEEKDITAVQGKSIEINASVDPGNSSIVEMKLFLSDDGKEYTSVKLIKGGKLYQDIEGGERWTILIDPTNSSLRPEITYDSEFPRAEFLRFNEEPLNIQVFLDNSVIEVFANNQATLIERVYPLKKDSKNFSILASGEGTIIESISAWQMSSIW